MRCLTLAQVLTQRGARVTFICNRGCGAVVPQIERAGLQLVETNEGDLEPHPAAFGARWAVLDHYGTTLAHERAWLQTVENLAVIADHADRPYHCNLLIHPSMSLPGDAFSLALAGADVLAGADYAPLRRDFAECRPVALDRRDGRPVRRIMIMTGMTDYGSATVPLVETARRVVPEAVVDVVVGPIAPSRTELERRKAIDPNVILHVDPMFPSALATEADVALGALGTATFERCCLGLPTIAIVLADNQLANAAAYRSLRLGAVVDWRAPGAVGSAEASLAELCQSSEMRIGLSRRCANLVDGLGAERIADRLLGAPANEILQIRPAEVEDALKIWAFRNDPNSRAASLQTGEIAFSDHLGWYQKALASSDRRFFIGEAGDAGGYMRFDRLEGDVWRVSIALAPQSRGMGMGAALLIAGCDRFFKEIGGMIVLRAEIRADNVASLRTFTRAGFAIETERDGIVYMQRRSDSC